MNNVSVIWISNDSAPNFKVKLIYKGMLRLYYRNSHHKTMIQVSRENTFCGVADEVAAQ